jgi:hypothetical protein
MPRQQWPKPRPALAAGWTFTTQSARHQSLGYRTPRQIYQQSLWICGRSALPTGCASPLPERARKPGKCSPSPTYPQALQLTKRFILMPSKSGGVAPATAPTMIGADIEGEATP